MSLIDLLDNHDIWKEFLETKLNNSYLPVKIIEKYKMFIENKNMNKL